MCITEHFVKAIVDGSLASIVAGTHAGNSREECPTYLFPFLAFIAAAAAGSGRRVGQDATGSIKYMSMGVGKCW